MDLSSRTIAAIATASGGGIGIIRVSGPAAVEVGRKVCVPWPKETESHRLYLGRVVEADGEVIDQVMFCLMRAPRTYTGEDVVEIHGHGGQINLQRLLGAVLAAGASAARPGEFTKRAFLNGKLDLTRAEALAALIDARSVRASRLAQRQMAGGLEAMVRDLRRRGVQLLSQVEGAIDFPDLEETGEPDLGTEAAALAEEVAALARSFERGGRAVRSGIEVAFIGHTNAGKSSLINALAASERLLVDASPGTTRDFVEVRSDWGGVAVNMVDMAGHRDEATDLERLGSVLARRRAEDADLIVLVVDGTQGLSALDQQALERHGERRHLVAWNKLDQRLCREPPPLDDVVVCSALCGWGLHQLQARALQIVAPQLGEDGELLVISERQARLLKEAALLLRAGAVLLRGDRAMDLVAAELRRAVEMLGAVTGESLEAAVVDGIFEQFCVGK